MHKQDERPSEEEAADRLWRAITALQAMTDRLLAQHGRTAWGQDAEVYSLASLPPARASGSPAEAAPRWWWRSGSARPG